MLVYLQDSESFSECLNETCGIFTYFAQSRYAGRYEMKNSQNFQNIFDELGVASPTFAQQLNWYGNMEMSSGSMAFLWVLNFP